jgi:hypothetical protein
MGACDGLFAVNQLQQVAAVSRLEQFRAAGSELIVIDEASAPGNLFGHADLQTLAAF